jgi:hypothetical protein
MKCARSSRSTEGLLKNIEGRWKKRSSRSSCMFQERSARRGHARQASHSTTSQQHDRGNPQCEHITPLVNREVLSNMLVDHNKQ